MKLEDTSTAITASGEMAFNGLISFAISLWRRRNGCMIPVVFYLSIAQMPKRLFHLAHDSP